MLITKGFGRRVHEARLDTGMSQRQFATTALSPRASAKNIGRIENEEVTPKLETLAKIASASGVSLSWLMTGRMALAPNDVVTTGGVSRRIRLARLKAGLSRNALSTRSGLGETTRNVQRLENRDHRPRARTLVRLASVLKVSPTYLAYGT